MSLFVLALLFPIHEVLAQSGTIKRVSGPRHAKVTWDSVASVELGKLAVVLDEELLIAVAKVTESKGPSSVIEIPDSVWQEFLQKGEAVRVLDIRPATKGQGQGSLLVWSEHSGAALRVDGSDVGKVPIELALDPGSHELSLDLPEGGRAGALLQVSPGRWDGVLLTGREQPAQGKMSRSYLLPAKSLGHDPREGDDEDEGPSRLTWIEDADGSRIYRGCKPVQHPRIVRRVTPKYPAGPQRMMKEGRVVLEGVVGSEGHLDQAQVLASSDPEFSRAALEAVLQWQYEPGTLNSAPVPVVFTVFVDFFIR